MKLDRQLQKSILETLRECYPGGYRTSTHPLSGDENFCPNLFYLLNHKLIESEQARILQGRDGFKAEMALARITVSGLDFLENDGGLSAILNKVTVKFDEDDLNRLLISRIKNSSEIPDDKKSSILASLKTLPAEGMKTLVSELLKRGLDNLPAACQSIEKILS
ncbi:MAG: hypothetical protein U9Q39_01690 [Pseudomonadota bacterium]|nr:hypothetical protein [Pseudomonadota bacterium]